jgi:hypothetical protein
MKKEGNLKRVFKFILIGIVIVTIFSTFILIGCKKKQTALAKEAARVTETVETSQKAEDSSSLKTSQKTEDSLSSDTLQKFTEAASQFILPIDEKYLETAAITKRQEGDTYETYFFLDPGAEIKAVIAGKIVGVIHDFKQKSVENSPAYQIFNIDNDNSTIKASYVLIGKTLVEEGDIVTQGQKIAISDGGDFAWRQGNYFIVIADTSQDNWEYLDLLK